MTARTRRNDAAGPVGTGVLPRRSAHDRWHEALKIRQEWLEYGLSTEPADRRTAEHHLTAIYTRLSRPRPRFVWADSPDQAVPL
ncbi:hypothetical protein ACFQ07_00275, partial [Actinomadura adrarensis]